MSDILPNVTEVAEEIIKENAETWRDTILGKILLWSSNIVNWMLDTSMKLGFGMQKWQASAALIIIDLVLILAAWRYIVKPLLKIAIIALLLWILVGFFAPIN